MHIAIDTSQRLADLGPRYAETDLTRFPVDAWATWTNLIFLFVIVYWFWRLRGRYRQHRILTVSLPLLTAGWIGGTVYHATRSHVFWTLLDWVPIVILVMLAAAWLWRRLLPNIGLAIGVTLLPLLVAAALFRPLANSGPLGICASYALIASSVIVPAVWNAARGGRRLCGWFAFVFACFAVALTFRLLDAPLAQAGWPHGSHYLWHLFGGVATFGMFQFLYELPLADTGSVACQLRAKFCVHATPE